MKKRSIKLLKLNKQPVSNFKMNTINGGLDSYNSACCIFQSYGTCEEEPLDTRGCPHN